MSERLTKGALAQMRAWRRDGLLGEGECALLDECDVLEAERDEARSELRLLEEENTQLREALERPAPSFADLHEDLNHEKKLRYQAEQACDVSLAIQEKAQRERDEAEAALEFQRHRADVMETRMHEAGAALAEALASLDKTEAMRLAAATERDRAQDERRRAVFLKEKAEAEIETLRAQRDDALKYLAAADTRVADLLEGSLRAATPPTPKPELGPELGGGGVQHTHPTCSRCKQPVTSWLDWENNHLLSKCELKDTPWEKDDE